MKEMTLQQKQDRVKLLNDILNPMGFIQCGSAFSLVYRHELLDLTFDLSAVNPQPNVLMKHILLQFKNEGKKEKLSEIQRLLGIKD